MKHPLMIILLCASHYFVFGQATVKSKFKPDSIVFASGTLKLRGLLWKPPGKGPFPVVLYNHGSEAKPERFISNTPDIFLEHGYAYFVPFRRGQGLSKGEGKYIIDELDSATKASGVEARFDLMIKLQQTSQLADQIAALSFS
jgi:cephalosporin-C deacetylase-like acetyl esterase